MDQGEKDLEMGTLILLGLTPSSSIRSDFVLRQKGHVVKEKMTTGDPVVEGLWFRFRGLKAR